MNKIFDKRGITFFVVFVLVGVFVTAFLGAYNDDRVDPVSSIFILGSGLFATFLFQKVAKNPDK